MQFLDRFKEVLENPFFKTLADFIKMFKSSKSFYSVFYFLTAFTLQQAIVWKYDTALSTWFHLQGNAWYWSLGAFVFEHGSIELVGLGVVLIALLSWVEINKSDEQKSPHQCNTMTIGGDNSGIAIIGKDNHVHQHIDSITIFQHKNDKWIPWVIVAFVIVLSLLPNLEVVDRDTRQIQINQTQIQKLQTQKLFSNLSIEQSLRIDNEIERLKDENERIRDNQKFFETLSLSVATKAKEIRQTKGNQMALEFLRSQKVQDQQREIDKKMQEFAQKFQMEARLLIEDKRYEEAKISYKNMIFYNNSYKAWFEYGNYLDKQEEYEEAIVIYKMILFKNLKSNQRAMTLHKLATIYLKHNQIDEALIYFKEALMLRKKLMKNNPKLFSQRVADTLHNIGLIYQKQDRFNQAIECYKEALEIEESLDSFKMLMTYNNLGIAYAKNNQNKSAMEYYTKAKTTAQKFIEHNTTNSDYHELLANILNNLGNFYTQQKQFQDANLSYSQALKKYKKISDKNPSRYRGGLALTYNNVGFMYLNQTQPNLALKYFQKAKNAYEPLVTYNPKVYYDKIAQTLYNIGVCYRELNQKAKAMRIYTKLQKEYKKSEMASSLLEILQKK